MTQTRNCDHCTLEMPVSRTSCPHCGRPSYFPNVDIAQSPEEKQKLNHRFHQALGRLKQKTLEDLARNFLKHCENTVAVFACSLLKLHREVASSTDIFETYYDLERLKLLSSGRKKGTFDWAKLRPQAEIELLGSHHHIDQIHYACLSIDGQGLDSYGDCTVVLSTPMIAHRASCFEGNTAVVYYQKHDFPRLLRSGWKNRQQLCISVFEGELDSSCNESRFPGILVQIRGKPENDRFIEVHVFGPMTAKTFESIRVNVQGHKRREQVLRKAVREKLGGIPLEEIRS